MDSLTPQVVAACFSFTGLYGVLNKRAWGPLLCGVASFGWAAIALSTAQYPWMAVELAYALVNVGIARVWSHT